MTDWALIDDLKTAAADMLDKGGDTDVVTLLEEAAQAIREQAREISSLTFKYKDCARHCERYYIELDGIVKSLHAPYKMGVAPVVDNVGSEVRRRLEDLKNG